MSRERGSPKIEDGARPFQARGVLRRRGIFCSFVLLFLFRERRRRGSRPRLPLAFGCTFTGARWLPLRTSTSHHRDTEWLRLAPLKNEIHFKEKKRKKDPVYLHFPAQGAQMEFKMKMVH